MQYCRSFARDSLCVTCLRMVVLEDCLSHGIVYKGRGYSSFGLNNWATLSPTHSRGSRHNSTETPSLFVSHRELDGL